MTAQNNKISYDEVPYSPFSFGYTTPNHLRTIGLLFGLNPPKVEKARILEMGCGVGSNMFNFAEMYPNSYSLGIDLSKKQIEQGIKVIENLKLKNVDLKHLSIMDLDESYGKFDYIICHGVFSWVPDEVKEKILEVTNKLLNPNGIAFVSYNTLPGWNMQKTIREMMMFHSEIFQNNNDKLQQAKLLLSFINESLGSSSSSYAKFLQDEAKILALYDDSYLLHEYLGEENTGFYFYQFIEKAQKHKLAYLGDTSPASMFIGNLPPKAAEKLQGVNDIVRTEQYMDFITNRKFRSTLLCHNNVPINRNIEFNKLKNFYTTFNIRPVTNQQDIDLTNEQENIGFYYENSREPFISTTSPVMKAILYVYSENIANPISLEEVAKAAFKKLGKFQLQDFLTALEANFVKFIFQGFIKIYAEKPNAIANIAAKPKVSEFLRYQVKYAHINSANKLISVTNRLNDMIGLQIQEKYILELLDGTNTIADIEQAILKRFISKELTANDENAKPVTDEKLLKEFVKHVVTLTLEKFRINYFLIG
ncbi:methyltransferase regulatory domain-containing protein [Rickettsia endosymbiont of Halotydeus destructor]|uniref:methyltransferase regulatory domain-containing protein n=1 Tax=Rickettsia endosymbiont of Halotydeus destructor TaxID=2996754 RepID=UPI003BB05D90